MWKATTCTLRKLHSRSYSHPKVCYESSAKYVYNLMSCAAHCRQSRSNSQVSRYKELDRSLDPSWLGPKSSIFLCSIREQGRLIWLYCILWLWWLSTQPLTISKRSSLSLELGENTCTCTVCLREYGNILCMELWCLHLVRDVCSGQCILISIIWTTDSKTDTYGGVSENTHMKLSSI